MHDCNAYCVGGWHATVLYSTHPDPSPGHFDIFYHGCITEHEPAKEAPLHPELAVGTHGEPSEWRPYLVRWRKKSHAEAT